jgi:hypothetical protein
MSQDNEVPASFSSRTGTRTLLSSEVIEIRNCLQVMLCLEYTLEQSRVIVDNVGKIDKLLSDETRSLEALPRTNSGRGRPKIELVGD